MKNRMNQLLGLLALASITVFSSCTDDTPTPEKTTPKDIVASGTWTRTAMTVNPGYEDEMGNIYTDALAVEEACERDNTLSYNENGTGIYGPGKMKCDGDDEVLYTFDWSLNSDGSVITKDGDDHKILELTENKMVLEAVVPGNELEYGDPYKIYTITMTLER